MRTQNACDGCTIRRVKCQGTTLPCVECRRRSLECTFLRTRGKPGPKGPRLSTAQKIKEFQRKNETFRAGRLITATTAAATTTSKLTSGDGGLNCGDSESHAARSADVLQEGEEASPIPRLLAVWPVVDCDALLLSLAQREDDYETRSLAAAICAAVIAQLRLPEHMQTTTADGVTSHHFALDADHFRTLFNYRETFTISSVMIPFFLHVYYSNTQKLRAGGLLLRECVSFAQAMRLDQPLTYSGLPRAERALRLRVFWILFVSERTFCAENRLPPILTPIGEFPIDEEGGDLAGSPFSAFLCLVKLFVHLERDFVETSPSPAVLFQLRDRDRYRISQYQSNLSLGLNDGPFDETQRVDLFVTRQWIRTLLWEYTVRHFSMSCKSEDQAFSMLLPISIAHETLSLFHAVSNNSLQPHGYGMELKVFRMADSLVDTLACVPSINRSSSGSPSRISFVAEGDVDTEASVGQSDTNSPMLVSPDTVNISL
ncbi:putative aflyd sugr sugar regulator protein [Eutypa lata UCREL1]|uniref:Putative aflyd sugr sugar regulator protein n=1 Tax=Eutypa lata (strain UCR-EL1) TaxID=1287681 RepID=M7SG00_EUTLA|nr:putative aflyd sugr sugar regulator protein [Eutypa lata UCREL1]